MGQELKNTQKQTSPLSQKALGNIEQSGPSDTYLDYTPMHHYLKIACTGNTETKKKKSVFLVLLINQQEIKLVLKKDLFTSRSLFYRNTSLVYWPVNMIVPKEIIYLQLQRAY